jgi:hypothetical protein
VVFEEGCEERGDTLRVGLGPPLGGLDSGGLRVIVVTELRSNLVQRGTPHAEDVLDERGADFHLVHRVHEPGLALFPRRLAVGGELERPRGPGHERGLDEVATAVHGNLGVLCPDLPPEDFWHSLAALGLALAAHGAVRDGRGRVSVATGRGMFFLEIGRPVGVLVWAVIFVPFVPVLLVLVVRLVVVAAVVAVVIAIAPNRAILEVREQAMKNHLEVMDSARIRLEPRFAAI